MKECNKCHRLFIPKRTNQLYCSRKGNEKCYLETLSNMIAANKFYLKYGFTRLDKPGGDTGHYACDVWYIKKL